MRVVSVVFVLALASCQPENPVAPDRTDTAGALNAAAVATKPVYQLQVLDLQYPRGINDDGIIVGSYGFDAAIWSGGLITRLPRVPGDDPALQYRGLAIASNGLVVGQRGAGEILLWSTPRATPAVIPALATAEIHGVNAGGTIVGRLRGAFRYNARDGLVMLHGPFGPGVVATSITDNGWISGHHQQTGSTYGYATTWNVFDAPYALFPNATVTDVLTSSAAVGAYGSGAPLELPITPAGLRNPKAMRWDTSGVGYAVGPSHTATSVSWASGVSERGRIVGRWESERAGEDRPWTQLNDVVQLLPKTGLTGTDAYRILDLTVNSCGTIIAESHSHRTLLWTKPDCDGKQIPF